MQVTNKIKMDLSHKSNIQVIDVVQNDYKTRNLVISLFEGGKPWEIPSNVSASVSYKKPDGTSGWYDELEDGTPATSFSGNEVSLTLNGQALTVPGEVVVSLVLNDSETLTQVASFPFVVKVSEFPTGNGEISNNYYKYKTIGELNAAIARAPAFNHVESSDAYNRKIRRLVKDGFYLINADDWDDLPVEMDSGAALLVFRYSPNYVLQVAVSISTGAMQSRIVKREIADDETDEDAISRKWAPGSAAYRYLDTDTETGTEKDFGLYASCNRKLTNLVDDGVYAVISGDWDDYPCPTGAAVLTVRRYSPGYVMQSAVSVLTGETWTRIVSRTGEVYREWSTGNVARPMWILMVGDSIARGVRNAYKGFVGDLGVPYKNEARSRATLSNFSNTRTDDESKRAPNIASQLLGVTGYDPDIVIADGGVNDYAFSVSMGAVPDAPATEDRWGTDPQPETALDGLECLLYNMKTKYPDAKHYFLLTHKTLNWPKTANKAGYTQTELFDAIKEVCALYGVEVIDVFGESPIDTSDATYVSPVDYEDDNTVTYSEWVNIDGVHPLDYGYRHGYVPIVRRALGLGGGCEVDPEAVKGTIRKYLQDHPGSGDGLPEKLPNPYALTIGDQVYDGSEPVKVEIPEGSNGLTPYIGDNGNWWIGETDTGTQAEGKDGAQGPQGEKGDKGDTGETGPQGPKGPAGSDGADGYTPVKGVDYYTDADKSEFSEYIATELAKRGQLAPEYANSIEECTDTTKLYVLPDGYIYAYMLTEVEVEGGGYTNVLPTATKGSDQTTGWVEGKGYSTSSRLSGSGGNAVDGAAACSSGFIPCEIGDVFRIKNFYAPQGVSTYVVSYDSSKQRINSQTFKPINADTLLWDSGDWYTVEGEKTLNGITTFTLTEDKFGSGVAYIRFSGIIDESTIVTINEEIKEKSTVTTTGYAWASTGHAFVPADYESRILELEAQTEEHSTDIANLKKGIANITDITEWDAPIYDANIPVFQLSAEKAAMTNAACTPDDIYAKYDALMAKHPNYITKTDLGLCSDGVNHVYRYDFREPDSRHTSGYSWSETKTKAIIVSGIHYEWSGIYGLYYALEEIADNPELYSFRRNSHLIVVPCMNPYATIESNYNNSKGVKNANGVEIHRNFEVGWILSDSGDLHYGGAKPISEVETQYVDTIMRENADAALFLTCHSFADTSFNFIWPSTATPYMCNMGYRLIDKLSNVWMEKHGSALVGLEDYRTEDIPSWDNRLGFAHISMTPGTETRQGTKYGIQSANVEINGRFWTHGTKASPEPAMSTFTMSRGAEVYVNFLLTVFGVYDPKDKALYS